MVLSTIIMGIIAFILIYFGYSRGHGEHIEGTISGLRLTLQILPILIFAFIIAGMVQVLIPQESIAKWIGGKSGMRGILIGTLAGSITTGGPYISMPLAAGLLKSGAGIGTVVAFLTGWSLLAVSRLPIEVGVLGWKFSLIRYMSTIVFAPIAGLIAHLLFGNVKL